MKNDKSVIFSNKQKEWVKALIGFILLLLLFSILGLSFYIIPIIAILSPVYFLFRMIEAIKEKEKSFFQNMAIFVFWIVVLVGMLYISEQKPLSYEAKENLISSIKIIVGIPVAALFLSPFAILIHKLFARKTNR